MPQPNLQLTNNQNINLKINMELDKQNNLIHNIAQVIELSRQQVKQTVNTSMLLCYWEIGRLIIEEEQQGASRAEYGKKQLEQISNELTQRFGKGFDTSNLRRMRQFYKEFPIRDTVCHELSWSHYRRLLRVENLQARAWYLQEAINQNWSVRALDRQISVLYYERLLVSQDKTLVKQEAEKKTEKIKP